MNHKDVLKRLDKIEKLLLDLRLVIIEDVRGSITPALARQIASLEQVGHEPEPPRSVTVDLLIAKGVEAGVFTDE